VRGFVCVYIIYIISMHLFLSSISIFIYISADTPVQNVSDDPSVRTGSFTGVRPDEEALNEDDMVRVTQRDPI